MIKVFYGPKFAFEKEIVEEEDKTTLTELAIKSDSKSRQHTFVSEGDSNNAKAEEEKEKIDYLVGYSDDYSGLSENAIQSFVSFLSRFEIENIYLQNPPLYIVDQLEKLHEKLEVKSYKYKQIDFDSLSEIYQDYDKRIIGQSNVMWSLIASLYSLAKGSLHKPLVVLFYGPTGVGKTETAKLLSEILGQKLFRKQFSMFHSEDFAAYLFGGKHSQNCFARELLERESNIILLDEFDKPNPVFHSAFYQLFDEGIFEDKNYRVEMQHSVIICTSNFTSEENIREKLGDPIYSRFDTVIKFSELSFDAIRKIISNEYEKQVENLDAEEQEIIKNKEVLEKVIGKSNNLKNARQIRKVLREAISYIIVQDKILQLSQQKP